MVLVQNLDLSSTPFPSSGKEKAWVEDIDGQNSDKHGDTVQTILINLCTQNELDTIDNGQT